MADIQLYLDQEDEDIVFELQQQLPRNRLGHMFSKKSIFRFLLKKAIRDRNYVEAVLEEFFKPKEDDEE